MTNYSSEKLFEILFAGEPTCYAKTPYETELAQESFNGDVFFSINTMHTSRADANVTCFRNVLIECDNMPLIDQIDYVTSKVPVTSIVYSGGKSYHFIISLAEPCSTREEYDTLVRRIHKLLPEADPTSKNPSRFSRLPGAFRQDTGKEQKLIQLNSRIPRATLEAVLPPVEPPRVHAKPGQGFFSPLIVDAMFKPEVVMAKVGIQSRNQFFFWLGQRLKEGNASPEQKAQIVEQTYSSLKDKHDFSRQEAFQAGRVKE